VVIEASAKPWFRLAEFIGIESDRLPNFPARLGEKPVG